MAFTTASTNRRGAIDVARIGALLFVVIGHLTLAVVDRGADGALRGVNLLALHPDEAWIAVLAPMPVFFAAGGWANATSSGSAAVPRLRALIGLGAVVVVMWSAASVAERWITGEGGIVADGARIATQPLWFVAAYVPLVSIGRRIWPVARHPVFGIGTCLMVLAVLDLARFAWGAPTFVGWPGFFLAWGVPWLLGSWWRFRWSARPMRERRTGLLLAGGAFAAAATLVLTAGYRPTLIDVVDGERSNTTPPTLFTAIAGIAQVGVLMVVAGSLDTIALRHGALLRRAGAAAVGVYVWHLTAFALCVAALAAGLWAPERFTPAWWLTRPFWFAAVLAVTAALVVATARVWAPVAKRHTDRIGGRAAMGMVSATVGGGVVGLIGPRTTIGAIVGSVAFVLAWWALRGPSDAAADRGP